MYTIYNILCMVIGRHYNETEIRLTYHKQSVYTPIYSLSSYAKKITTLDSD